MVSLAKVATAAGLLLFAAAITAGEAMLAPPHSDFPPNLFVSENLRGYRHRPNFSALVEKGRPGIVEINAQGYRGGDWRRMTSPIILLAGSSATFGLGLQQEETIAERLRLHLSGAAATANAGTYGYGPPQVAATIRKECPVLKPALVLYLHEYKLTRRDFMAEQTRTVIGGMVTNREAASSPTAAERPPSPSAHLRLPVLRQILSNYGWHPTQIGERFYGISRLSEDYRTKRYLITSRAADFPPDNASRAAETILEMAKSTEDCGAAFAAVILPGPGESYYGIREPATQGVLAALQGKVAVWDLRDDFPLGRSIVIPGMDYPNPETADRIADGLARRIAHAGLLTGR